MGTVNIFEAAIKNEAILLVKNTARSFSSLIFVLVIWALLFSPIRVPGRFEDDAGLAFAHRRLAVRQQHD